MEFSILYALQNIHTEWMDMIMVFFTKLGSAGMTWIIIAVFMLIWKKTRMCGITSLAALNIMFLTCNVFLKNAVKRMRPCWIDTTVELLIPAPQDYSFPSGHTFAAFTAAYCIYYYHRKAGIMAFVLAGIIGFSRLYLFVHFPTDVLAGMILGILTGMLTCYIMKHSE